MFYLDIFRTLDHYGVRYALVGGVAMSLHGVPRMTMDVDLVVATDDANLRAFLAAASELGLSPAIPGPLERLLDAEAHQRWIREKHLVAYPLRPREPRGPTVEFILVLLLPAADVVAHATVRDVSGVPVRLASIPDMIRLEEASGRRQDLADTEQLRKLESAK